MTKKAKTDPKIFSARFRAIENLKIATKQRLWWQSLYESEQSPENTEQHELFWDFCHERKHGEK